MITRIIGIDPGSQRTGYGVIEVNQNELIYVASGVVKLPKIGLPLRLKTIFDGVVISLSVKKSLLILSFFVKS